MDNLSDESLYKDVLENFADTAKEKIACIKEALNKENYKDYVIYVHALKSNAKTIGAMELFEQEQNLESIGKRRFVQQGQKEDLEVLIKKTPKMLYLYEETAQEAKKRVLCY